MVRHNTQTVQLSLEQAELLVRMDERLISVEKTVLSIQENLKLLDNRYVEKEEFIPVKNVVYGLVGLFLTGLVGAIISLVLF